MTYQAAALPGHDIGRVALAPQSSSNIINSEGLIPGSGEADRFVSARLS
jgi:hypothetical protein